MNEKRTKPTTVEDRAAEIAGPYRIGTEIARLAATCEDETGMSVVSWMETRRTGPALVMETTNGAAAIWLDPDGLWNVDGGEAWPVFTEFGLVWREVVLALANIERDMAK